MYKSVVIFLVLCFHNVFDSVLATGETCKANGLTIPLNEEIQDPEQCLLYKCQIDSSRIVLNTISCAPQEPRTGCRNVDSPVTLPFPDCCPLVVCEAPVFE